MIFGIGCDLCAISRMEKSLTGPHGAAFARRVFGPAHRYALPVSVLFGGAFMVLSDLAARTVMSPTELPVGAVTALIGAPFRAQA